MAEHLIEGDWLYLIEDEGWNLKLGFSSDLYNRLYDYRQTAASRGFKTALAAPRCWVLGVRPGTQQEEREFHKAHVAERLLNSEWYSFKSRAAALLLLQDWQEPPMKERVIWTGEGPHYSLVHHKTTSQLASLLSRSRVNKRGAAVVLEPCSYCGIKYGARALRKHIYSCPERTGKQRVAATPLPYGTFGKCSQSPEAGMKGFHQTGFHCPKCDANLCAAHKGAHNRQFHPRPGSIGKPSRNPAGRPGCKHQLVTTSSDSPHNICDECSRKVRFDVKAGRWRVVYAPKPRPAA